MSSKKVSAKHSADKKKIIMIELKKEIIENHERSACSGLSKLIRQKHIDAVNFFLF